MRPKSRRLRAHSRHSAVSGPPRAPTQRGTWSGPASSPAERSGTAAATRRGACADGPRARDGRPGAAPSPQPFWAPWSFSNAAIFSSEEKGGLAVNRLKGPSRPGCRARAPRLRTARPHAPSSRAAAGARRPEAGPSAPRAREPTAPAPGHRAARSPAATRGPAPGMHTAPTAGRPREAPQPFTEDGLCAPRTGLHVPARKRTASTPRSVSRQPASHSGSSALNERKLQTNATERDELPALPDSCSPASRSPGRRDRSRR